MKKRWAVILVVAAIAFTVVAVNLVRRHQADIKGCRSMGMYPAKTYDEKGHLLCRHQLFDQDGKPYVPKDQVP